MMRGPRCDRLLCGFRYRLRFLSQPSAVPDSLTEDIRTHVVFCRRLVWIYVTWFSDGRMGSTLSKSASVREIGVTP